MSIRMLSVELVPLTHDLAVRMSTMPELRGERPLRPSRLKNLRDFLKAGEFGDPNWATVVVKDGDGTECRANGNHSSHVLAELPPDKFPQDLQAAIQHYEIDSLADAKPLFQRFDAPLSARTNTDTMAGYRAEHEDLAALDLPFLVQVGNAIDFYLTRTPALAVGGIPPVHYGSRDHGLYFGEIEYRNFALWLYRWNNSKHSDFTGRSGVMAEALADWKTRPALASEFWGYVFLENHPDPSHESRELVDTIKDMIGKPKYKQADYRSKSKRLWSRFRRLAEAEARTTAKSETEVPVVHGAIAAHSEPRSGQSVAANN